MNKTADHKEYYMDHLYIQISPADLIDKYSITLMKLAYMVDEYGNTYQYNANNVDSTIKAEKGMLEHVYRQMNYAKKDDRLKQLIRLNSEIWDYKNDLREKSRFDFFNRKFIKHTRGLIRAEDARKELKKAINRECLFDYLDNNHNQ